MAGLAQNDPGTVGKPGKGGFQLGCGDLLSGHIHNGCVSVKGLASQMDHPLDVQIRPGSLQDGKGGIILTFGSIDGLQIGKVLKMRDLLFGKMLQNDVFGGRFVVAAADGHTPQNLVGTDLPGQFFKFLDFHPVIPQIHTFTGEQNGSAAGKDHIFFRGPGSHKV